MASQREDLLCAGQPPGGDVISEPGLAEAIRIRETSGGEPRNRRERDPGFPGHGQYRLAPEHPFPAAIDDVLAAWRWLLSDQDLSARSMAVAGGSAGGGLAVALLVTTHDAGEALPAAAALMSPTVDLTSSGASMTERADQDPISTPAMLRQFASDYLAGADPKTVLASPLFASLSRLPPLLVQVGTADLLLSDSERLATAAAHAGVASSWRSARACLTSTSSCSAPPRQPRPPSRSGRSCEPGYANRTAPPRRITPGHRSSAPRLNSLHPSADYAVRPPSMCRISPVTYRADSRYRMPSAMSLTWPTRPSGGNFPASASGV
jgi:alpha/beta hydrolase fold